MPESSNRMTFSLRVLYIRPPSSPRRADASRGECASSQEARRPSRVRRRVAGKTGEGMLKTPVECRRGSGRHWGTTGVS
ncbi:hypothetical protein GCM10010440_39440 [Kitasatospora cinereorecta]